MTRFALGAKCGSSAIPGYAELPWVPPLTASPWMSFASAAAPRQPRPRDSSCLRVSDRLNISKGFIVIQIEDLFAGQSFIKVE